MLIAILTKANEYLRHPPEVSWEVNEQLNGRLHNDLEVEGFVCNFLQADGDELEYIQSMFQNIPLTSNKVQKWRGDFAAFIYDHLPRSYDPQ